MMDDRATFIVLAALFIAFYLMPVAASLNPAVNGFALLHEYATEHFLACLLPAFFIAGAISVFVKRDAILKYLGPESRRYVSYSIASVSGAVLAVCSCTILPLFAGIRDRGAGLGPAVAFLFSGPAINIAAIMLTFSVLGFEIGIARVIAAILIAILVGFSMELMFREKGKRKRLKLGSRNTKAGKWTLLAFFSSMVIIILANGLQPGMLRYAVMVAASLAAGMIAMFGLRREDSESWLRETWRFSRLLIPYLFIGVFIAGFIMPLLPGELIEAFVGQNTVLGNLIASVFGAFMYFSTMTEIPILQAFMAKGMSSGPALALLLAGPSLSLPNMLVIRGVLGNRRTAAYVALVVVYSTIAGLVFGYLVA